jgi:pimeloyl-ACP methyl ester carboxylesterase
MNHITDRRRENDGNSELFSKTQMSIEHIDVKGINIALHKFGCRETMILVHSSACDNRQWRGVVDYWADTHHVLAPDLIGCGDTDPWHGDAPPTLGDDARIIELIISQQKGSVHLIGHSYGGVVALKAALANASRLSSLTLIEPTAFYLLANGNETEQAIFCEIEHMSKDIADFVRNGDLQAGMMRFVDYWWGSGTWQNMAPKKQAALVTRISKVPNDLRQLFREPVHVEALQNLQVSTLVICGTASPKPARAISRIITQAIPNCRHRTIGFAGHMSPVTHIEKTNALIGQHLCETAKYAGELHA